MRINLFNLIQIKWIKNSLNRKGFDYYKLIGWHNFQFRTSNKLLMINFKRLFKHNQKSIQVIDTDADNKEFNK
jgi:hypothetical protein